MKIVTKELEAMTAQTTVLCDAIAETDPEKFMAYVGRKYPVVAVALYDLMKRSIDYEISLL